MVTDAAGVCTHGQRQHQSFAVRGRYGGSFVTLPDAGRHHFFHRRLGVLTRRNAVIILLSIELMFNAVNITVVAFSRFLDQFTGQIFAIFVITVAAAEATIGLAIVISSTADAKV